MTRTGEPEHELVRRLLPYSLPAFAVAALSGALLGGAGAAWSAGIGVAAVTANFLGYAYRKTGKFDASFNHYSEALKLNPKHKHAHEYIGEAYLLTDNLPKAEQHLAELQKLCTPIPCEEYKELKRAVDAYKKTKK